MRILRNVLLIVLPILLMINLYRWAFASVDDVEFSFKGISYIHEQIQTFHGLKSTLDIIDSIKATGTSFENLRIESVVDVFNAVGKLFQLIGMAFSIPVMLVVDVAWNVWWIIDVMFIR